MTAEIKLLPFTVNSVQKNIEEIPYGIKLHEAPYIWEEKGEKGAGVVVAVLDTGVDYTHPDLKEAVIDGRNFTGEGSFKNYMDLNGHGTHVAGTIAARENETGVVGIAPECKILALKCLDKQGSGSYWSIIEAIRYAAKWKGENGERVRVINMSLGGSANLKALEDAILEALSKGIAVVVASGNEGDNDEKTFEFGYPSNYQECITVAACDENKKLAPFSNNHKFVDVIAAGVDVLSTYPKNRYASLSGTSMATPHISGLLALLVNLSTKKFEREMTEAELYAALVKTTTGLGYKASTEGHGLPELSQLYKRC